MPSHSRIDQIRTLVADCNEQERLELIDQLCAGNWGLTSDVAVDIFHDALTAMDDACALYARVLEDRQQRKAA